MIRRIVGFLFILGLVSSGVSAQTSSTRSALETLNNTYIKSNGVGAITGPILNNLFGNIIASEGTLLDLNVYAQAPIFTGNTGVGYWNGSSAPSFLTNTQITALINPATTSLSGALPAWPNNTTTFLRGDGTYAEFTLPTVNSGYGAIGSSIAIPVLTTDAQGRILTQTSAVVIAPAGTLTGISLASNVTGAPGLLSAAGGSFGTGAFNPTYVLPNATTSILGGVKCDGVTITCAGGVITSIGSAATSIAVGSTTISSGTTGYIEFNNGGVLGEKSVTGTGSVVLASSSILTTPNLGTPSAAVLTNATGLPISTGVSGLGTGVATAAGNIVNGSGGLATSAVTVLGSLTTAAGGAFGTSAFTSTGTTGGTVPLNNGGFTQSGIVNFTNTFEINGNAMIFPTSVSNLGYQSGSWTPGDCLQASSVAGGITDAGAGCGSGGSGGSSANTQDFLAGVGFTAGVTTSLVLTGVPVNANALTITFDGVVQSHDTWSLSISTITFNSVIPSGVLVVEAQWLSTSISGGTVTTVSVVSANGFVGTVANPTTTSAITISTSITGLLKGNGTAISAASAGSDYLSPTGNGSGLIGILFSQIGTKPTTLSGYGITDARGSALVSGDIWVGNGAGASAAVAISGDATLANTGALSITQLHSNTLTNGDWCSTNGTIINCTVIPLVAATTSTLGTVKCDGTTITCASGVISASSGISSVAASFTGGLVSIAGTPITTAGTLAFTVAGTSGGIPYFSSSSVWASSGALTVNMPVIGGGAGAAPTVGSISGNTTKFATSAGTLTPGDCIQVDSNSNYVDAGGPCTTGGGGGTVSSGTAHDLAYYASTGTAVTGLTSGNNGVLVTNGSGVPSISTTLPSGLSAASFTVTTAFTATGLVTLGDIATQAANTVLVNATASSASPTAEAMSSCSATGDAVIWTTSTGFGCNTSITAAAAPISGLSGGGTGVLTALGNAAGATGGFATYSSLGTAAFDNVGTSGGTIPLLNGTNVWSGPQTVTNSDFRLLGSSSGYTTFTSNNASVTNYSVSVPAVTDTLAVLGTINQVMSGGVTLTPAAVSVGNVTVNCGLNPVQYIPNTGAFTITNPSSDGTCILQVENGSGAGTVTFTGFSEGTNKGDALDTTSGHNFQIGIYRIHSISHYLITALQ